MHYFYIKEEYGRGTFTIYAAPRNLEYKAHPWPYDAMYCEPGSFFYDKMQWLEANSKLYVVSAIRTHYGGRFGAASHEIWIDDDDEALQFKLTFC
jgi:hypothetical protein